MHERRYREGALYMECAGSLIYHEQGQVVWVHPGSHADDPGGGLSEDRHRGRLSGRNIITFNSCSRCSRLSESPRRSQNPGPLRPGQSRTLGQPRTDPALLGDRPIDPRRPGPGRMGDEGDRPTGRRSPPRVPGDEGSLTPESEIYAPHGRGLARPLNCATVCCTNSVGPQLHPA